MTFSIKDFFTFTEEILDGKLFTVKSSLKSARMFGFAIDFSLYIDQKLFYKR